MGAKLTLVIADDEYLICGMLTKIIRFDELGLELAGTACDGESLFRLIGEKRPDIVITDISMPGMDGLEVIRLSRESGYGTNFILISGYRQFEYAYSALKYGVEDYILKPVDEETLNTTLKKVSDRIRQTDEKEIPDSVQSLRALFFNGRLLDELAAKPVAPQQLNQTYATRFTDGEYRIAMIKLDKKSGGGFTPEDGVASFRETIKRLISDLLGECCEDILYQDKPDGVMALFNYTMSGANAFTAGIERLCSAVRTESALPEGIGVTVCVSNAASGIEGLAEAKNQARAAEWSRLWLGIDRTIFFKPASADEISLYEEKLRQLGLKIRKVFGILNGQVFRQEMENFFSFPKEMLGQTGSCRFLYHVCDSFFEVIGSDVSIIDDTVMLCQRMNASLHDICTLKDFKTEFVALFTSALSRLDESKDMQQVKPVRVACAYVDAKYAEAVTLESAAQEVHLNPTCFSKLFKRETGKNFTEYVMDVRLAHAREMLVGTSMNISEIAFAVGFSDAQYFSKTFKKLIGVKPSEYREMRG